MNFVRQDADNWRREVPGARWFKADLHLHTIDDHPGGKAGLPSGLPGAPDDPAMQKEYARRFLRALVAREIQVAGLTPHSPRAGEGPETSAVWRIVEEWNDGDDDDGVPFRQKVFAVFPGFEVKVNDGKRGVHLLALFDPEVGRPRYLDLFDAVMRGVPPWEGGNLRRTGLGAAEVFETLDGANGGSTDDWLALGAHFENDHGVDGEMNQQGLDLFPLERLTGLGLSPEKLPDDLDEERSPGKFWLPLMRRHRQAFFHGSDAYTLDRIGRRYTWIKMASPRIEALRQAFIANDSRIRIGFERSLDGEVVPKDDPPVSSAGGRPWLRTVTVQGSASFFGGEDAEGPEPAVFSFSPDLTCVIGGSMTGKSTLLDGLRVHTEAELPKEPKVNGHVRNRAAGFLGAGSAEVELDRPGGGPWHAVFFAQNELQRLVQDDSAVEDLLARLDSAEAVRISERRERLTELDGELERLAETLNRLDDQIGEAAQAESGGRAARAALDAFQEAGIDEFHRVSRDCENWKRARGEAGRLAARIGEIRSEMDDFALPSPEPDAASSPLRNGEGARTTSSLLAEKREIRKQLRAAAVAARSWSADVRAFSEGMEARRESLRTSVERALAARGRDAAELQQFQDLSRQAALLGNYERHLRELQARHDATERQFGETLGSRRGLVEEQRAAFDRIASGVLSRPGGRVRARRQDDGDERPLTRFLESFRQRGITRWWKAPRDDRPNPAVLLDRLANDKLTEFGMSPAVQQTFRETLTTPWRRRLAALRCPDRYVLELEVGAGVFRPLHELSGGQRVSLLLTLLLETEDDRPLVIDQPEDELDNRSLFGTVLPALKKLKGRRQVIVATHNANIVVNGDADMVIQLEASADRGRIACAGAIDDPAVRDAIVQTVDGGQDAFRLRRRKYGF